MFGNLNKNIGQNENRALQYHFFTLHTQGKASVSIFDFCLLLFVVHVLLKTYELSIVSLFLLTKMLAYN